MLTWYFPSDYIAPTPAIPKKIACNNKPNTKLETITVAMLDDRRNRLEQQHLKQQLMLATLREKKRKKNIRQQQISSNKNNVQTNKPKSLEEKLFADSQIVDDRQLDEVRGAFTTSSGLLIDFGLITQTIVNGDVVSQLRIDDAIDFQGLQQLIQISNDSIKHNNSSVNSALPSISTVIQNTANNQLIQNLNILNLEVSNFDQFKQRSLVPIINLPTNF